MLKDHELNPINVYIKVSGGLPEGFLLLLQIITQIA